MKRILIICIAFVFLIAAFSGCTKENDSELPNDPTPDVTEEPDTETPEEPSTPDYLKHEKIDKTSLSLENSKISFTSSKSDNFNLGLDVTVNGETVLDDIMFVLERKISNGFGEKVLEPIYDEGLQNFRAGYKLLINKTENGVELEHTSQQSAIKYIDMYMLDNSKDYAIVAEVDNLVLGTVTDEESNTPGWEYNANVKYDTKGNVNLKSAAISLMPAQNFSDEGRFCFYISDMIRSHLTEMDIDLNVYEAGVTSAFQVRGNGTKLTLKDYKMVQTDLGFRKSETTATVDCYTDGFESTLKYPNGTKVTTFDYFSNEYTVARKITLTENGLIAIGGKVDGSVSYDGKNYVVYGDVNGVEYAVAMSRKQIVEFYDSEEDLLSGNATDLPTENTKFWVSYCPDLRVGESVYMAVSTDTAGTDIDLVSTAKYAIDAFYRIDK